MFSWVVGDILQDLNVGVGHGVMLSDAFWLAWIRSAAGGSINARTRALQRV